MKSPNKSYSVLAQIVLCLVLLTSCTEGNLDMLGMFYTRSEGSDERFAHSMEYNTKHGFDTVRVNDENYTVYVMTDIHVDNTTYNLDTFTTTYLNDAQTAPFCLCLGDLINSVYNYPKFMAYVDTIRMAGREVYSLVGNHDIYFDQWKVYRDYWHTATYYFIVETPSRVRDLYICLDSSDGTLGHDQRQWLDDLFKQTKNETFRHRIVCTHTHLWKIDQSQGHTSNFALEETYDLADLFSKNGVELVLQGHSHHRQTTLFKGVTYLRLDKMEDHYWNSFYTIFTIGKNINWEYVPVGPYKDGYNEVRIEGR